MPSTTWCILGKISLNCKLSTKNRITSRCIQKFCTYSIYALILYVISLLYMSALIRHAVDYYGSQLYYDIHPTATSLFCQLMQLISNIFVTAQPIQKSIRLKQVNCHMMEIQQNTCCIYISASFISALVTKPCTFTIRSCIFQAHHISEEVIKTSPPTTGHRRPYLLQGYGTCGLRRRFSRCVPHGRKQTC